MRRILWAIALAASCATGAAARDQPDDVEERHGPDEPKQQHDLRDRREMGQRDVAKFLPDGNRS